MEPKGERAHADVLNDPGFPALKHYIIQTTGLSYYEDRENDLAAAILRTLGEMPWSSASEFLSHISAASAGMMDRLTEELTIGETFFFRHAEMFAALREHVFPEIHRRRSKERVLRIWSAACSIGAEPYSLSILLRQDLAHLFNGWEIEIFGTDINRRFLAIAQKAEYENWALRSLPEERRRCFVQRDKKWVLQPRFAKGVTFFHHNLVRDRFPSLVNRLFAIDLIVCRNVMIYFSHETVKYLAEQFHQTLVPGGWLAVGHAEPHTEIFRAFRTVNTPGAILYQRHTTSTDAGHDESPLTLSWEKPVLPELPASSQVERSDPRPQLSPPSDVSLPARVIREPQQITKVQPHCIDFDSVKRMADSGDFARARVCCEQLLTGDQLNPALHFLHALLLEHSGFDDEARSALRRVLYLGKDLALAHYHLGVIEERRGNRAQALRSWRNAQVVIEGLSDEVAIPLGDGLTAADLRRLLEMHVARPGAGSQG